MWPRFWLLLLVVVLLLVVGVVALLFAFMLFCFFFLAMQRPWLEVFVHSERRCAMSVIAWVLSSCVELERLLRRTTVALG